MEKNQTTNWFKNHADTIVILGVFSAAYLNLNEKVSTIEKDMAIVKTVIVMKNIMPGELCKVAHPEEKKP